jgi:hypothetical protein
MIGGGDWVTNILIVLILAVIGWFGFGTIANVRAGNRVMKWLREGLAGIGEKTTMNWIGSAAIQFKIAKAKGAFRDAETVFAFEPRDVVLLWLFARLQGRRDLMIFRATLNNAPDFELEIFDPQSWLAAHPQKEIRHKNWQPVALPAQFKVQAYYSGAVDVALVQSLINLATRAGAKLTYLSIRRSLPNLQAHWLLPDPDKVSARALFSDLRELGNQAIRS